MKISQIIAVGMHHLELGQIDGTQSQWDAVRGIYAQRYFLPHHGEITKGKETYWSIQEAMERVFGSIMAGTNCLVVVPNLPLFLACCDLADNMDRLGLSWATVRPKPKLPRDAVYGDYEHTLFVRNGDTIVLSLEHKLRKIKLGFADTANFGLCQFREDNPCLTDKIMREMEVYYFANDDVSLARTSLRMTTRYLDSLLAIKKASKLKGFAFSIGGIANGIFRESSDAKTIEEHTDEGAAELERDCYLGARMQAFGYGRYEGKVYHVDIASHYPFCASAFPMPTRLERTIINPTLEQVEHESENAICFARVSVSSQDSRYPIRRNRRITYANGLFVADLCGPELAGAIKRRHINEAHKISCYGTGKPLESYMRDRLTSRRIADRDCDKVRASCEKYLANAMIGRLAQTGSAWVEDRTQIPDTAFGFFESYCAETGHEERYRIIDWKVEREIKGLEIKGTFPAISAVVNSHARKIVSDLYAIAGERNTLIICSDCLVVNEEGYLNLLPFITQNGKEPGRPYLAGESDGITVVSPTIYRSDTRRKASGEVRPDYPTPQDFLQSIAENAGKNVADGPQIAATRRRGTWINHDNLFADAEKQEWRWFAPLTLNDPPPEWALAR